MLWQAKREQRRFREQFNSWYDTYENSEPEKRRRQIAIEARALILQSLPHQELSRLSADYNDLMSRVPAEQWPQLAEPSRFEIVAERVLRALPIAGLWTALYLVVDLGIVPRHSHFLSLAIAIAVIITCVSVWVQAYLQGKDDGYHEGHTEAVVAMLEEKRQDPYHDLIYLLISPPQAPLPRRRGRRPGSFGFTPEVRREKVTEAHQLLCKGVTQGAIADRLGIAWKTLQNWDRALAAEEGRPRLL